MKVTLATRTTGVGDDLASVLRKVQDEEHVEGNRAVALAFHRLHEVLRNDASVLFNVARYVAEADETIKVEAEGGEIILHLPEHLVEELKEDLKVAAMELG